MTPPVFQQRTHSAWSACGWIVVALAAALLGSETDAAPAQRFYVNYSAAPSASALAAFDLCVLDPAAQIDLKPGQTLGHTYLAYVSAVEAHPGSINATEANKAEVPVVGRNDEWNSLLLDVEDPKWLPLMLDKIVSAALAKGYDGVFLDTLDSAKRLPGYSARTEAALEKLVLRIRERFPEKKIVLNRGFELLPKVARQINGVLVESVYQTFDPKTKAYAAVKPADSEWLITRIKAAQAAGVDVYAIDYVDPAQPDTATATAEKLKALGCSPFITTPELQGANLGPWREVARRILVVHGTDAKGAAALQAAPPIDTMTATHFQAALEWMGYEFDFHDIGHKSLPASLPNVYAGVILDELDCRKPMTKQTVLAWLQGVKMRRVPILFAGDIPFTDDDIRSEFAQTFGLGGDLTSVYGVKDLAIREMDPVMMKGETAVEPRKLAFRDLSAPLEAEVYLSLKGTDRMGRSVRFDPCFMAPWGGVWLEPYIVLRASQANRFFYADVYRLLERWLHGQASFPVPDTTTRDGRRIFYSHIDGDGFASLSHFPNHPPCAEVVRDRILKRYPLPVTVSVVEVDVRGWLKTLKKEDAPRYEELARSMFALPHVQAGSHSFSHPFIWDSTDPNPGHYDTTKTTLAEDINYPAVDPEREIRGSIDYINKNLLPAGKQVELMLWSGNCRPGEKALRLCRELGVENMNGGETIISKLYPSISGVGPRLAKWGEEIQIFAANQNEFMYANGFQGPHYGGFADVIDTFQLTEKPRRLKPVNVYYHFYSSTFLSSNRALEQIHEWCMSQPLHPITALQFASIVRDAHRTQIYQEGERHWRIANTGALRTYRLPASAGLPNISQCNGVTGYKLEGDALYVHTTGQPLVELKLSPPDATPPRWPFLVQSSADVTVEKHTAAALHFTVTGWNKVALELGGLPAGIHCPVTVGSESATLNVDSDGQARLTVPPGTRVQVDIPSEYAATP